MTKHGGIMQEESRKASPVAILRLFGYPGACQKAQRAEDAMQFRVSELVLKSKYPGAHRAYKGDPPRHQNQTKDPEKKREDRQQINKETDDPGGRP